MKKETGLTEKQKSDVRKEFMDFLKSYGVIGLAIAVVMGSAVTKLVSALVQDWINPFIGMFLKTEGLTTWQFTIFNAVFKYGDFIAAFIDFIIIALIIFLFAKWILKEEKVTKK